MSGCEELDVQGKNVFYPKLSSDKKGEAPLEPNHTKFILIDDGTMKKFGGEIVFRAKLEQAISAESLNCKRSTNSVNQNSSSTRRESSGQENSSENENLILLINDSFFFQYRSSTCCSSCCRRWSPYN